MASLVGIVGGRSDRQHAADRLDSVRLTVVIDEGDHHLGRRSSLSHSEIRGRLAEDLVRAAEFPIFTLQVLQARTFFCRRPRSHPGIAFRLAHPVPERLAEQPIFPAIETMAAHCDGYSAKWSCTSRTARSRTSGEYFVDLFMTPTSHELEPPTIRGDSVFQIGDRFYST